MSRSAAGPPLSLSPESLWENVGLDHPVPMEDEEELLTFVSGQDIGINELQACGHRGHPAGEGGGDGYATSSADDGRAAEPDAPGGRTR